jgi:hypothetical protein
MPSGDDGKKGTAKARAKAKATATARATATATAKANTGVLRLRAARSAQDDDGRRIGLGVVGRD